MSLTSKAALLAHWDSADAPLAPLTNAQRDAVITLSAANAAGPSVLSNAAQASTQQQDLESASSVTKESVPAAAVATTATSGFVAVETGGQFLQWLHQEEKKLQEDEDKPWRDFIAHLEEAKEKVLALEDAVDQGLADLQLLGQQHAFVSEKSTSLHTACQDLLKEQKGLSALSAGLGERLIYYTEADRITQRLQSTAIAVHSEQFRQILDRTDECYNYVLANPNAKQSGAYSVKYHSCLSRALGMVRAHVKSVLEAAVQAASSGAGQQVSDTAFTLFYGKFRSQTPRVAPIIEALEARLVGRDDSTSTWADLHPTIVLEYESALGDCQGAYFACRNHLLLPSVRSAVVDLSQKYKRDHCGLVRAGCAFILHVCEDEWSLFHHFFKRDSDVLTSYLESLCQVLYDTLRPLVIHLHHLETLSELTSILRSEMLGHHCAEHPPQLAAFERIISQLLQDVQERLVYRAYIYIRTDIEGYNPAAGDLAYPEKLEMMESIAESIQMQQSAAGAIGPNGHQRQNSNSSLISATSMEVAQINGGGRNASNSPADLHGMWYPPVRRTLVCLSKLYRCLEREIFQGLSQEALMACMGAVSEAAKTIATKKTAMDGQLFEIKHLLILREQIAPFHVEFSVREMSLDFSKLKSAALSLLTTKRGEILSLSSNNALLEFLLEGTPEVKEYCKDSRKEVDKRLKHVCEEFIADASKIVVGPFMDFMAKVDNHRKSDPKANISREAWGKPSLLQDLVGQCQRQLKKLFPTIQRAMQLYLCNRETEFILFRPIRNQVLSSFISFSSLLRSEYTSDEQIVVGCPSQEQIAVTITSLQLQPKTPKTSISLSRSPSLEPSKSAAAPQSTSTPLPSPPEEPAQQGGTVTEAKPILAQNQEDS